MGALPDRRVNARIVARWAKMFVFRSLGRSDYARWTDPSNLEAWWASRTQRLASLVPTGTRVIEFGAGARPLERCLDASCTYMASDLVERGPDTFVCDLNHRPLPDLDPLHPEVAVFAGVLEYVRDVPSVIAWLSAHVKYCVTSYAVAHQLGPIQVLAAGARRTYYGYMNTYSEVDFVEMFRRGGFACGYSDSWNDQRLFQFERGSVETRS
jgi:hypothetical protein